MSATVLGLVGRDLLLDAVQAVADDNAPAAFELAGRAVEMGYDLRAVCRELSRVVRDLLVLTVDPVAHQRSRDRRRNGARSAEGAGRAVLARGSAAGVRSADAGGGGNSRRGAAAVSPRDGAPALDLPAEAGADRGADCGRGVGLSHPVQGRSIRRSAGSGGRSRQRRPPTAPDVQAGSRSKERDPTADTGRFDVACSNRGIQCPGAPKPPSGDCVRERRRNGALAREAEAAADGPVSRTPCSPRSRNRKRSSTTWSSRRPRRSRSPAIA